LNSDWIEGRFEGIYSGPRRPPPDARPGRNRNPRADDASELRRFDFEIQSGQLRDFGVCHGPDLEAVADDRVIRQRRVKHVRLAEGEDPDDVSGSDRETSLFDVHISDWQLKYPAEAGDRAYGTIVGTLRARRMPADMAPAESIEVPAPLPETSPPELDSDLEMPIPASKQILNRKVGSEVSTDTFESAGWALVMLLLAVLFAGIVYGCGFRSGVVWLAPIGLALGILWLTGGGLVGGASRWILGALPIMQLFLLWTPLEIAWQTGCWPAVGLLQMALIAMPIALAAVLGARKSLWLTGAIRTNVL
jgi:hypothetical protein